MLIENLKRLAFFLLLGAILTATFSISLYEILSILFILTTAVTMVVGRDARVFGGRWTLTRVVEWLMRTFFYSR